MKLLLDIGLGQNGIIGRGSPSAALLTRGNLELAGRVGNNEVAVCAARDYLTPAGFLDIFIPVRIVILNENESPNREAVEVLPAPSAKKAPLPAEELTERE